jgi:glutamine amidotransferase-like uncharacterized protein
VTQNGMSYLRLCAGGIAASQALLFPDDLIYADKPNRNITMIETKFFQEKMHLKLYSGACAALGPPAGSLYGIPQTASIPAPENRHVQGEASYPLYFQSGIFFPNAEEVKDTSILLRYSSYELRGLSHDTEQKLTKLFNEHKPAAAIKHQNGTGNIVLSGVHPEISAEIVRQFPEKNPTMTRAKQKTIQSLEGSTLQQSETMKVYLDALSIATKLY